MKTYSYESNNQWKETIDKLTGTEIGEQFGSSLSIAFNKSNGLLRMAVGSPGYNDGTINKAGLATVYELNTGNEWSFMDEIAGTTNDDKYGGSLKLSGDAGLILLGSATDAELYSWAYDEWRFLQDSIPGVVEEVALSDNGSLLATSDGKGNVNTYVYQLPDDLQNPCISKFLTLLSLSRFVS